jgi:hypothetical protein
MMAQLVYVSTRKSNCDEREIGKILDAARNNNLHLGITGVLLYTDTKFVQLLEGEAKVVMDLYKAIGSDTRHEQLKLIMLEPVRERSFPSWQMGVRKMEGGEVDFKTTMSREDMEAFKNLLNGGTQNGAGILDLIKKIF